MITFDVYKRDNTSLEWELHLQTECLSQAFTVEDTLTYAGWDVKIINSMTGRRVELNGHAPDGHF